MSDAVFLEYDRAALDAQLNNRARFPDYAADFARWRAWSENTRATLPAKLDIPYGPSASERLDIFPVDESPAPVYVFIHGGWWYSLDKDDNSFVAEGMAPHGVLSVLLNYGLAPAHRMDEIVRQARASLVWLRAHVAQYGGDPERIFVAGHSAGGHLAAMLASTDWASHGAPADLIKGACAISGVFDLEPIRLSYHNATLGLTADEAARNSPIALPVRAGLPFTVAVGALESEEFQRQSRAYYDALVVHGAAAALVTPPELHHFDVIDQLREPQSELVRLQLERMS